MTRAPLLRLVLLASLTWGCIPATNPFDPDTDPSQQVPAVVRGAAAYPSLDGTTLPPDGIAVVLKSVGADGTLVDRGSQVTSADDDGAFAFDRVAPGAYVLEASAFGFGKAQVGPLEVGVGDARDVGTIRLVEPDADADVAGAVTAEGLVSVAGVEVSLRRSLANDGDAVVCGPTEATARTGADGAWTMPGVRPGRYVVVARTEGATVDVSDPFHVDADATTQAPALVIRPGSLVASVEVGGRLGATTSSARQVTVHVLAVDGMDEMQLGADPTFDPAAGGTGWGPFSASTSFALPGDEGPKRVYVGLRGSCATSPLYGVDVVYDATPPVFLSAKLDGQEGVVDGDPPLVVVGDQRSSVGAVITAQDVTGVSGVQFLGPGDDPATAPFSPVDGAGSAGAVVVRLEAPIDVGEGLQLVRVRLRDGAGNMHPVEDAVAFRVLRDLSPPSTPLPSVDALTVTGDVALVWLDEPPCPAPPANRWVCEANLPPDGPFEVRGGPDLLDFAPVVGPPFSVTLHDEGDTLVEIRSVDAAGNASNGVARVTVTRASSRTLFTAPTSRELGPPAMLSNAIVNLSTLDATLVPPPVVLGDATTALRAAGGTAFFTVRPRAELSLPSYYTHLVAQPTDVADVGLVAATSPFPDGVRKQSLAVFYAPDRAYWSHQRVAGALGAQSGALSWLEWSGMGPDNTRAYYYPTAYATYADGDGRFRIATPGDEDNVADLDGEIAPYYFELEDCAREGRLLCQATHLAWSGGSLQAAPTESSYDGRRFVVNGSATTTLSIDGPQTAVKTVTGPRVVAARFAPAPGASIVRVAAATLGVEVPAGTRLAVTSFYQSSSFYEHADDEDERAVVIAGGTGSETIPLEYEVSADGDDVVIGVLIPAGVQARIPIIAPPDTWPLVGVSVLDRADTTNGTQPLSSPDDVLAGTMRATLHLRDRTGASLPNVAGVTALDWGDDGVPGRWPVTVADVGPDAGGAALLATERTSVVASEPLPSTTWSFAAAGGATDVPDGACAILVRADDDVVLRGLALHGFGLLDRTKARVWELDADTPFGRYTSATGFDDDITMVPPADEGVSGCSEIAGGVGSVDSFAGTVGARRVGLTGVATSATVALAETVDGGVAAGDGEVVQVADYAVTPGQFFHAEMSGGAGELDLHVRWDAPVVGGDPSDGDDCVPYDDGNDERCGLYVPDGVARAYVGVHGYYAEGGSADLLVRVMDTTRPHVLAPIAVSAGEMVEVALPAPGDDEDHDVYVRFGADPTLDESDCAATSYRSADACILAVPAGETSLRVAVDEDLAVHPQDTGVRVNVWPATSFVRVGTFTVAPDEQFRVVQTGGGDARLVLRDADDGDDFTDPLCDPAASPAVNDPTRCGCVVDGATNDATCTATNYGYEREIEILMVGGATAGAFSIQVEHLAQGCTTVESAPFEGDGVLRAGRHYVVTFAEGKYYFDDPYSTAWPPDDQYDGPAPRARFADPVASDAYGGLSILGAVQAAQTDAQNRLIVTSYDGVSARCAIDLVVASHVRYRALATVGDAVYAVREIEVGGVAQSTIVRGALDQGVEPGATTTLATLSAGARVDALTTDGATLTWVESTKGRGGTIRSLAIASPSTTCKLGDVDLPAAPLALRAASFADGALAVAGQGRFAGEARVYRLAGGGAGCATATLTSTMRLDEAPIAAALDGPDLYVWDEPAGAGGRLMHHDLRRVVPLHPGGAMQTVGFDADDGDVAIALLPVVGSGTGRLVELVGEPPIAVVASDASVRFHPTYVADAVASIVVDATGAADLVLRARAGDAAAPVDVPLPDADVFQGAPAGAAFDPIAWAKTPVLAADGDVLAALGYAANGQRLLVVWEVPTGGPTAWATASAALGPIALPDSVDQVFVSGGLVVVTTTAGDASAYARLASGAGWGVLPVTAAGDDARPLALKSERVVGAVDGRVAVLVNPGDVFAARPPLRARMELRPVSWFRDGSGTIDALQVPAELFLHSFATMAKTADGDVLFYDTRANPPALWRARATGGTALVDDGPHRPLSGGAEAFIGASAAPRVDVDGTIYFVEAVATGRALSRMRR